MSSALDELVERSAAPYEVRLGLQRLDAGHPGLRERLVDSTDLARAVVAVLAASRSLTRVLETDEDAVDVLADLDHPPSPVGGGDAASLVAWKRRELLRIAARDLLGIDQLETTGGLLAAMAATVFDEACSLAGVDGLAVIAMGKAGGAELNYASDVDVLFVAHAAGTEAERAVRRLLEIARRCFRVDVDLRPEGRDGPLVRTLDAYTGYWARWAQPWELQALLKARPMAGDRELGGAFAEAAADHLWERPFSPDDIRSVRAMKERAEQQARQRLDDRELKVSRGGIRDVEFAVQLLQLVHGHHDPELRFGSTLAMLASLSAGGYVDPADADRLADAYRFLRNLEHRLQLVDEQQVHRLPADRRAQIRIARVLGLRPTPTADEAEQLDALLADHRRHVRSIHERLYFRPLLEAFADAPGAGTPLTPAAAAARLAAFGFADTERTRRAVAELTRGLTRSSRLMQQLMPLLLDWLSRSPDPDAGLLGLRRLAAGRARSTQLAVAFRDSPDVARRLCRLLGTSRLLSDRLLHHPDFLADLAAPEPRPLGGDDLQAAIHRAMELRADLEDQRQAVLRTAEREGLRVGAEDVLGRLAVDEVGTALTELAESVLACVVPALDPGLPFAVIAVGRFGGSQLSYASDLDLVFVYDGTTAADTEEADRLATGLQRFLVGSGGPVIYPVDLDLRPEGRNGPLARTLDGYRAYLERWAQAWERHAMVRARPVAGDLELGAAFMSTIDEFVWAGLSEDDRRELRRMKARIERERIPPSEDPAFHLKLGRGSLADVEFCAQTLQLAHGVRETGTTAALEALAAEGHLAADDARVLTESYRFCERTRNRWFLINGLSADSLPTGAPLGTLARSFDTTAAALRDDYRRVTRRARSVVERLFYGKVG